MNGCVSHSVSQPFGKKLKNTETNRSCNDFHGITVKSVNLVTLSVTIVGVGGVVVGRGGGGTEASRYFQNEASGWVGGGVQNPSPPRFIQRWGRERSVSLECS